MTRWLCGRCFLGALFLFGCRPAAEPLPLMGTVGEFSFTERSGREFTHRDTAGKVWIADFVFTYCAGPCPLMTTKMSILQNTLPKEVRFVTFSVDPERDTPARLREYAETYGADKERWVFLTGAWEKVDVIVKDRFHLVARKETDPKPGFEILHDTRFALVDRVGRIRGYYRSLDEEEMKKLDADARRLVESRE